MIVLLENYRTEEQFEDQFVTKLIMVVNQPMRAYIRLLI